VRNLYTHNCLFTEHEQKMEEKRSQLSYEEVTPCKEEVVNRWRSLLSKLRSDSSSSVQKVDLWSLVKEGSHVTSCDGM